MGKKLIVLSADAMVSDDVEYLRTLPNYQKYLSKGCWIQKVESIYPSVTYPCHVTMMTGAWPEKHGVTSNYEISEIEKNPIPWVWFHDSVRTDDIFSAAKRKGLSTASVFWPVTGNHPDIDYLIDEYWTQGEGDNLVQAFKRSGSSEDILRIIERHKDEMRERIHPMCDEFMISCACDIIREKKPDLLMIHPANIDAYRHERGLFNDCVRRGVEETDRWIGALMEAVKEAGLEGTVNLVLTSDHGQQEIKRIMNLNVLLAERGYIRLDEMGGIIDWKAYCLPNGLSALVYVKDSDCRKEIEELLTAWKEEEIYGISEVFTEGEARERFHLGGEFSFVLESDDFTAFGSSCVRPLMEKCGQKDYRYGNASHGHLPSKGPWPTLIAAGPDFRENVVIEQARLIDEAPTYAKLLGCDLRGADGEAVTAILR